MRRLAICALVACGRVGFDTAQLDSLYTNDDAVSRDWWNPAYRYRRQLRVVTATASVSQGYAVAPTIEHAPMVSTGRSLADGNDVRIVIQPVSRPFTELDRVIDPIDSWNTNQLGLWFGLAQPIASSTADGSYFLYYGNPNAAAAPANLHGPFPAADLFDQVTLDPTLAVSLAGSATAVLLTGRYVLDMPSTSTISAATVSMQSQLPADLHFALRWKGSVSAVGGPIVTNPDADYLVVVDAPAPVGVADQPTVTSRRRIEVFQRFDGQIWIFYIYGAQLTYWNGTAWIARSPAEEDMLWTTLPLGTELEVELASDGTSWWIAIRDGAGTTLTTTAPVQWTAVQPIASPAVMWGEPFTDYYTATVSCDWFLERPYVSPEPMVTVGPEESMP